MNQNQMANLRIRLKGFAKPDTSSQVTGFLEPGKYQVESYLQNYPNKKTDFMLLMEHNLSAEETWICSRWENTRYADLVEEEAQPSERHVFDNEPSAIPESALTSLLPSFAPFTYDLDQARYPYPLPGVKLPQAPPATNNCCTFAEALLVRAWADAQNGFKWGPKRHGQMMIFSNDDYFSPVTAAVESDMGITVPDPDTPPHPWTLIQGWRRQWRGGHTFLIVDHHLPTDRVLTLESNSAYKLNGVGFRAIGNIRDFHNQPPDAWWERDDLWTWKRICTTYRFRQLAWLKVKDTQWSGL